MASLQEIREALLAGATNAPERAKMFFKTGPGSYAEHDEFMGITIPNLRRMAKTFSDSDLGVLQGLLSSKINEERLLALFILVHQYQKVGGSFRQVLYQFYMDNLQHVNNWNLVDASAHLILGMHIWDDDRSILEELARSSSVWQRRVSIVATWYFIRNGDLAWTFRIATLLLGDGHDLIHKAAGWMLREAGKRNEAALLDFLIAHAHKMPRTMLRYAIERLSTEQRQSFLAIRSVLSEQRPR